MALISKIQLPGNSTAYNIRTSHYGTCTVASSTANKTVSATPGFELVAGAEISVTFSNDNTADTPKLNVNSTGNKSIYLNGEVIGTTASKYFLSGTCQFVYDGTNWNLIGSPSSLSYTSIGQTSSTFTQYQMEFLTQSEYDDIATKDPDTFYFITE